MKNMCQHKYGYEHSGEYLPVSAMNTTENTGVYTVMSIVEKKILTCPTAMNTMENTCIYTVISIVENFGQSIAMSTMKNTDQSAL